MMRSNFSGEQFLVCRMCCWRQVDHVSLRVPLAVVCQFPSRWRSTRSIVLVLCEASHEISHFVIVVSLRGESWRCVVLVDNICVNLSYVRTEATTSKQFDMFVVFGRRPVAIVATFALTLNLSLATLDNSVRCEKRRATTSDTVGRSRLRYSSYRPHSCEHQQGEDGPLRSCALASASRQSDTNRCGAVQRDAPRG